MVIVPIGTFCYITRILEKLNYRYTSLPFDYIRSNIPMVNDCINNNFVDFLNKNNYTHNNQGIIKYGKDIFLHHDMGDDNIHNSMKRKTTRFLNLFNKHNIPKIYIAFFQPIGSWGDDTTVHQDGTNIDKIVCDLKQLYTTIHNRSENFHVIGIINKPTGRQCNKIIFNEEKLLIYELETITSIAGPTFTMESDELYSINILKQILTTINPNFEKTHVINYENEIEIPSKLVNSLKPIYVKEQSNKLGIFNSFPFHYEMFGFILNYAKNNNYKVDIFTNQQNNMGWLDFYKESFSNFNIIDFNNFNGNTNYKKLFVITDYDQVFKSEWINENVICINHSNKIKRPIFKHYLNVAQFKDSTFDYINPCYNLNSFQNKIQNNTVNIIGGGYGLNFSILKRLQSNNKIKLNIFVRNTEQINTEDMSILDKNKFDIHFKIAIDTTEMINEINKSSYIIINYNDNHDLNTGASCSGSMQLALSTLCKPIMAKTSNKYLQIENALEFDIDSDEPINIDGEIDFELLEQERNKYVERFEKYMGNWKVKEIYFRYDDVHLNILSDPSHLNEIYKNFITREHAEPMFRKLINHIFYIFIDKNIIDLGAYIGDNTIPWAIKSKGNIYAIDPSPENIHFITNMAKINNINNIITIEETISNKIEQVFYNETQDTHISCNTVSGIHTLITTTLDNLMLENIGFIHLDVEGFEQKVLYGAIKLITTYNPVIAWENHLREDDYNYTIKYLFNLGYDSYLINERFPHCRVDCRNFISLPITSNINIHDINSYFDNIYKEFAATEDKPFLIKMNNLNIVKESNIPKKIFQTWEHSNIEPEFQKIIDKWKENNHEYKYIFHDAEQRIQFIEKNFEESVVNAYNKIIPGAYKCDLWRYCVLYIYGGFYDDIDTLCMGKLNDLTGDNIDFIVPIDLNINPREGQHNLACGFIGSVPKSPILLDAINRIVFNVENNIIPTSKLDFSGPGLLGRAVNNFLKLEETNSFKGKEGIQNNINFLHFDPNTEYMKDVDNNKTILQNKNGNADIIKLYIVECNKLTHFNSWVTMNPL
jgi:FkbM family methyltransferase